MKKAWFERLADRQRRRGKSRLILDRELKSPYLERFYLHPRWLTLGLFRVVLHKFHRSDDASDGLHDHPWPYISILLKGSYVEYVQKYGSAIPYDRHAGDIIFARAGRLHRVELLKENHWHDKYNGVQTEIPCWTLFIMGPRLRKWGFKINGSWIPWKQHIFNRTGVTLND